VVEAESNVVHKITLAPDGKGIVTGIGDTAVFHNNAMMCPVKIEAVRPCSIRNQPAHRNIAASMCRASRLRHPKNVLNGVFLDCDVLDQRVGDSSTATNVG
jgi:hypothetical protein